MRTFQDEEGRVWVAGVERRPGVDYQGRYFFVVGPAGEGGERDPSKPSLALPEIQWNSERTAQRTLETMSEVELRRRLRAARGRVPTLEN